MRGSHGLSSRRAWGTLSSRPEGPKASGPGGTIFHQQNTAWFHVNLENLISAIASSIKLTPEFGLGKNLIKIREALSVLSSHCVNICATKLFRIRMLKYAQIELMSNTAHSPFFADSASAEYCSTFTCPFVCVCLCVSRFLASKIET